MSKEVDNLRFERELLELRSHLDDLRSTDWQFRVRAIAGLSQVKKSDAFFDEALPALIRAVRDENVMVRQAAIPILGDLGSGGHRAVTTLIECLDSNSKSETKAAIYALGKVGPDASPSIPKLIKLLATDDNDQHKALCWSLSMIGPDAVKPLLESSLSDDPRVVIGCLNSLGNMGPIASKSLPQISSFLKNPAPEIRMEAARSIGNLRAVSEISNYIGDLKDILNDNDPDVRWTAAEALRKIGTDEAMHAWSSYEDIGSVAAYLKQLNHQDKAVRLHAAEGLFSKLNSEVNDGLDFEKLKAALNDTYSKVLVALCTAIARLEDKAEPLQGSLLNLLTHNDPTVRSASAQCLGKINANSNIVISALAKLLDDKEKEVRMSAGLGLELLDTKEAREHLKKFKWE